MYYSVIQDLILFRQLVAKKKGVTEMEVLELNADKKDLKVTFNEGLTQVYNVESFKAYNVLREEEDCCETYCQVV